MPGRLRPKDDRMLVTQAITEPLHLLTSDEKLQPYSDLVVLV
jgi:PIN domain nuclease of toxin-antitoxin system